MIGTRTTKGASGMIGIRYFTTFAVLAAALAAFVTYSSASAQGTDGVTYTVNSTGDQPDANASDDRCDAIAAVSGDQCTLRAAIQQSNATSGPATIEFEIPGDGPHTISPGSQLPLIIDQVTIDGYSEPGAEENTTPKGATNAVIKIELDGTNVGPNVGLNVAFEGSNSVIQGLAINRFAGNTGQGIQISGTGVRVQGNFIGTDPSGTQDLGNGTGILATGSNQTIGGVSPQSRNLISGNDFGILFGVGGVSENNKIEGNLIGAAKNGTSPLGNSRSGVLIGAPGVAVGGIDEDPNDNTEGPEEPANTIVFNGGDGVGIVNNISSRISANSIHSNGDLGIDLDGGATPNGDGDGVTKNDKKDPDTGPNNLQNFPVLNSAVRSGATTTIQGKLNSRPRKTFTIQFFSNEEADASGKGEGKTFLGQTKVRTNREGRVSFSFPATPTLGQSVVTTTATNNATGDTSEFSNAVTAS